MARWIKKWLGTENLPVRELTLRLELPAVQRGKAHRPQLRASVLRQEWGEYAAEPQLLLESVRNQLVLLNRYKVWPSRRLKLLEPTLRLVCPVINDIYYRFREQSALPESTVRRNLLSAATAVVRELITGYKHILLHDYGLSDLRYARARGRIRLCGLRILELLKTEQRLSALRYQKLPEQAWRECSQVFFVLQSYEDIDAMLPLAGCLRLPLRPGQENTESGATLGCARHLFVSIQLLGLIDVLSWPSHSMHVVDTYLKRFEPDIALLPDTGDELADGQTATFFGHAAPPLLARPESARAPCLLLDITPLKKQLHEDCSHLGRLSDEQALPRISASLSVLSGHERRVFVERMRLKIQPRQRREARTSVHGQRDLRLYGGFMAAFRALQAPLSAADQADRSNVVSLNDMLAGRSSLLADDSRECQDGNWVVVNESAGGILLKTRENAYSVALHLGQLAGYRCLDTLGAVRLGYIARLHRTQEGEMSVTIIHLGSYAEAAALQDPALQQTEQAIPAVLMRDAEGRWQVALHARHQSGAGRPMFLRRAGQSATVVLRPERLRQNEFVVFDLQPAN